MRAWPGRPGPLGATFDGIGTNFAVFSEVAERVEVCVFDDDGNEMRVELPGARRARLARLPARPRRAGRATGSGSTARRSPPQPLQPAQAAARPLRPGHRRRRRLGPGGVRLPVRRARRQRRRPTAPPFVPKCVVVNPYFDWEGDRRPRTPWHETVIYEVHVKGATCSTPTSTRGAARHLRRPRPPRVRRAPRRRSASPRSSCCPSTTSSTTPTCVERGLRNYWGYNTIGYFAPHYGLRPPAARRRAGAGVQAMVRTLHEAGIEVILDVVYNHTAEGNHLGPTLSFKGIDNAAYYRLVADDPPLLHGLHRHRQHAEHAAPARAAAGHGQPALLGDRDARRRVPLRPRLHAGPRASTRSTGCPPSSTSIQQDPVVSQVKLIAEPWDVGEGGYQVGNFPPVWAEWNGRYRDSVRDVWRGAEGTLGEFAYRLTGSSDLYETERPAAVRLASTSSPPTTGSPCDDLVSLRRQAQRGQRRGQPRRHRRQPVVELRRRGPDRRPRDQRAAGPPAAQPAGHAAALPGRADARGRRRDRPHPGRQQQRVLPGQRDLLARLEHRRRTTCCRHPRADRVPPRAPHVPPPPLLPGPAHPRRRHRGPRSGSGPTGTRWATTSGTRATPSSARACTSTAHHVDIDERGQDVNDDDVLLFVNAHHDPLDVHRPRAGARPTAGRWPSTPTAPMPWAPVRRSPDPAITAEGRSVLVAPASRARRLTRSSPCIPPSPPTACSSRPSRASTRSPSSSTYLADLGVSHLYLSPVAEAVAGSQHGYDVTDPARVRAELGGEEGLRRLAAGAAERRPRPPGRHRARTTWPPTRPTPGGGTCSAMGRAAHHAATSTSTGTHPTGASGASSCSACSTTTTAGCSARGDLRLELDGAGTAAVVRWPGGCLPVAPRVLGPLVARAAASLGDARLAFTGRALARCVGRDPDVADDADAALDLLAEALAGPSPRRRPAAGPWRPSSRRSTAPQRPRRRPPTPSTGCSCAGSAAPTSSTTAASSTSRHLVGVRVEDPAVFADAHDLFLRLHREGVVDGFRVDHVDGLADPGGYLRRLRDAGPRRLDRGREDPPRRRGPAPVADRGHHGVRRPGPGQRPGHRSRPASRSSPSAWRERSPARSRAWPTPAPRPAATCSTPPSTPRWPAARPCSSWLARHRPTTATSPGGSSPPPCAPRRSSAPTYRSYVVADEPATAADVAVVDDTLDAAADLDPSVDPDLWSFLRACCSGRVPGAAARAGHPLPAAHRPGGGQGRRGHAGVPLDGARLGRRGGRGGRRALPHPRRPAPLGPGGPRPLAVGPGLHDHPRHQALRGRARPPRRGLPGPGAAPRAVRRARPAPRRRRRRLRPALAPPADRGGGAPHRRRPAGRLRPEGGARGQGGHLVDRGRRRGRGRHRGLRRGRWPTIPPPPPPSPAWPIGGPTPGSTSRSSRRRSPSPCPACPTSTRGRSCSTSASSTPTTAPPVDFGPAPRGCSPPATTPSWPWSTPSSPCDAAAPHASPPDPTAPTTRSPPPTTSWPTDRGDHVVVVAARFAWARRQDSFDASRPLTLPDGTFVDVLSGRSVPGGATTVGDVLGGAAVVVLERTPEEAA